MAWNETNQSILDRTEQMFTTLLVILEGTKAWIGTIDPSELDDEIRERVMRLAWRTEFALPIVHNDYPGNALDGILAFVKFVNPEGVLVQEFHDQEVFDRVVLETERLLLERERESD